MKAKPAKRPPQPATVRMEAARRVKQDAITRELLLVSCLTRFWPARLMRPSSPQASFTWLLELDTPAGMVFWRVTDDEEPLFAHVEHRETKSRAPAIDKTSVLLSLATVGFPVLSRDTVADSGQKGHS